MFARPAIAVVARCCVAAGWLVLARGRCGVAGRAVVGVPARPPTAGPLLPPLPAPGIVLELEAGVWAGVGCWAGRGERWVRFTVPIAYDLRYDTAVRPVLGANQVSRAAVLAVATARAGYAEYATGRHCRPTNERLALTPACRCAPSNAPMPRCGS